MSNTAAIHQFPTPTKITARGRHDAMIAKLTSIRVPVEPSVYDNHASIAAWLEDTATYLRAVHEALVPIFEHASQEANDVAWPYVPEEIAILTGGADDFIAPFKCAAERMGDE